MKPLVTIYSRSGCHLCENAESAIENLKSELNFDLEIKLIDGDKKLFINTDTFFKIKISFPDNKAELKIIYYTIDNNKGMIDCTSSDMLLDIIEANPDINPELVKGLRKDIIDAGVSNIGISMQ